MVDVCLIDKVGAYREPVDWPHTRVEDQPKGSQGDLGEDDELVQQLGLAFFPRQQPRLGIEDRLFGRGHSQKATQGRYFIG